MNCRNCIIFHEMIFFYHISLHALYRVNCCHAQTLSRDVIENVNGRQGQEMKKKCRRYMLENFFSYTATIYNLSSGKNLTNLMELH